MTTYLFPGQGSQAKGMGENLFLQFPDLTQEASEILGYSIADLCLLDPEGNLNNTAFTQPALFVVSALAYLEKIHLIKKRPDYVAGHSLGEYTALLAADAFDFATGVRLVKERGRLMSQAQGGGMAAVVGLPAKQVIEMLAGRTDVFIANFNSYKQVVITGAKESVLALQTSFEQAGANFFPLKVSGAFHSRYMADAELQFQQFMQTIPFSLPNIAVIANVDAHPYRFANLTEYLAKQMTHSVLWLQSMEYLLKQGETDFVEVGPGNVLTGLLKRITKNA